MSTRIVSKPPSYDQVGFASMGDVDRIGRHFVQRPFSVEVVERLQEYRRFRAEYLPHMLRLVQQSQIPKRSLVSARLKRMDTIHDKLTRSGYNFKLGVLDDVVGIRIVCQDLEAAIQVSERLESLDDCYRVKNYISDKHPAKTGYRGIHHILKFGQPITKNRTINVRCEVQVRTYLQHQWAITSESFGEPIKLGVGAQEQLDYLKELSNKIEAWEESNPTKIQRSLIEFQPTQNYGVVWRNGVEPNQFLQLFGGISEALERVIELEQSFPRMRENALLLAAVSDKPSAREVLQITHPLYVLGKVPDPSTWIPSSL